MELPLEAVPNFSEGRDAGTIEALRAAFTGRAEVLDVHVDADHNRSVFTLVGDDAGIVEALFVGIAVGRERIDLRRHDGAHPRTGAADVVPLVPMVASPGEMERAAPRSSSGGSTPASSSRTSGRGVSIRRPAP